MNAIQPHLRVSRGDIVPRVVLVRSPEQVEDLAGLLEESREVARGRGFLTVNGQWQGIGVSLLSVGMGGPSVSIAVEEAIAGGGHTFAMVEALWSPREVGEYAVVLSASRFDGTSNEYFPLALPAVADTDLASVALRQAQRASVPLRSVEVSTVDRVYGENQAPAGAIRDLSAGMLYPLSTARGSRAVVLGETTDLSGFARGLSGESLRALGTLALNVVCEDAQ